MMQRPFLIGLTGASGAGKTTFLNELKAHFDDTQLCVVSQDNYYRPKEEQEVDAEGIINFDLPTSINRQEFHRDIEALLNGQRVTRAEYTFNNTAKTAEMLTFEPCPLILVEGIFIYHYSEIRDLLDLKLFLDVKETIALSRRIKRDKVERGYPLDDVLYRYEHHVLPTYEHYIKPFRGDADLIINNNSNFNVGLEAVLAYLKSILTKQ